MITEGIEEEFRARIIEPDFPCVGAKSALATDNLRILRARNLNSAANDVAIHLELLQWSRKYRDEPEGLRSLAVIFDGPAKMSERQFERAMWERIQSFADKDARLGQPYDSAVSPDPADPHFSLSFGGSAFFVVGLHPLASRPAPALSAPSSGFQSSRPVRASARRRAL